ncbi:hypothetical protein MM213_12210 [Belliella sp. R4-6]|uniref:DUF3575 domain-containing protein n=1 Tax=Belliella alkalica TaxID=1730871 RepID=A0ABS9VCU1_9BACT|nr:hypothetical protein [Belliella alkalica]MCH7414256.1 hypothetical protein [Belliella alkalica]
MSRIYGFIFLSVILNSCIASKETVKFEIEDGLYTSKVFGQKEKIYLDNEYDSIYIFPIVKKGEFYQIDTLENDALIYPQHLAEVDCPDSYFTTNGFDIDLITIPFKYRFPVANQPQQLSTNLNASVYAGYRTDFYSLKYRRNKFGQQERKTRHYGLSFGAFSGFGSSPITPWFTNDQITEEYDGLVWSNGLAFSIGIDYLNLGFALGWDRLLDKNSNLWIYQRKPWLGLIIGININ